MIAPAYPIENAQVLLTPALVIFPDAVDANIAATLRVLNNDGDRWRPHLKTVKMPWAIKRLLSAGVSHFKCATTLELSVALQSGATDVLVAFPLVNAHVQRVIAIAEQHPQAAVSVLIENSAQAALWLDTNIGLFLDINPGMDRTGISETDHAAVVSLARAAGPQLRGLHYYDGHISAPDRKEREAIAHAGYDRLLSLLHELEREGIVIGEIVTSGTPAFPCSATYPGFRNAGFTHRASPGTVLLNDTTSLQQVPDLGYQPAAFVLSTVFSHPAADRITCDAGHKSVSADAGIPNCVVVGRPDLLPLKPSEEHLPIQAPEGSRLPGIGEQLLLLPKHVCPTVNNFDEALLIQNGRILSVEPVAARGHERAFIARTA